MTVTIITKTGNQTQMSQVTDVHKVDGKLIINSPFLTVTYYENQYETFTIRDDRQRGNAA